MIGLGGAVIMGTEEHGITRKNTEKYSLRGSSLNGPFSAEPEPDPDPQNKDTVIPPAEADVPGASKPLDDTPVPPLTEPADTNGG